MSGSTRRISGVESSADARENITRSIRRLGFTPEEALALRLPANDLVPRVGA